ncbi:pectinesterase family protein [Pontibacter sp. CAU 1760]
MRGLLVALFLFSLLTVQAQQKLLVVAQDGSGDYTSVQAAVDAVPAFPEERVEIHIRNGVYREKVIIPTWKTNLSFRGESKDNTILTWDDHAGKDDINTFTSYTLLVQGEGFRAENMTIENTAGRDAGQAVALHVAAGRCAFQDCRILGDQDTLYAGQGGDRQYFLRCYIEGTTDFIFGPATAVFEDCTIHCKKNSYITAASTPEAQPFGFVFLQCTVTASSQAQQVYLGRPWGPFAQTIFIHTTLGRHIRPEGWHNWSKLATGKTAFYAEYRSKGPGAAPKARVTWARQLTRQEAKHFTARNILPGKDSWEFLGE